VSLSLKQLTLPQIINLLASTDCQTVSSVPSTSQPLCSVPLRSSLFEKLNRFAAGAYGLLYLVISSSKPARSNTLAYFHTNSVAWYVSC